MRPTPTRAHSGLDAWARGVLAIDRLAIHVSGDARRKRITDHRVLAHGRERARREVHLERQDDARSIGDTELLLQKFVCDVVVRNP